MGGSAPPRPTPKVAARSEADGGERPTVVPEFDPEAFARDSEMRQRAATFTGGEPTIDQARRLHEAGDDEQALFLLARLLEMAPLHAEATALSAECRTALECACLSAIGSESAILVAAVSSSELKDFAIDNVSGFLFSLIDGATSVETILDLAGLPRVLALRHLRGLVDRGIVTTASSRRRR